ncbi:MAG: porin [Betaproteobacteria bacterium]
MKKTLVAMAVMAVAGAASAQATLYGVLDAGIQMTTTTLAGVDLVGNNIGLQQNASFMNGNRWGLKGTEDLGGGMSALYQVESGFAIDTGKSSQGSRLFGRQAYVGLSGGFGTVTLGRQYTGLDTLWGTYDAGEYGGNSAMSFAWNGGVVGDIGRVDSMIQYSTPAMSGFSALVQYAPGEDKEVGAAARDASTYTGLLVGYSAGPLSAHLAYESASIKKAGTFDTVNAAGAASLAPGVNTLASTALGISYDLGMAKLMGGVNMATADAGVKETGYMLGGIVPFGAATLNLTYAAETRSADAKVDGKGTGFAGHVRYSLSKRTSVYAGFLSGKSTQAVTAGAAQDEASVTTYMAGVKHTF